jgi:hypothetical protein
MPTQLTDIQSLILKAASKKALTRAEDEQLTAWRKSHPYHHDLPEKFGDLRWVARHVDEISHYPVDRVWEKIKQGIQKSPG